MRQITFTLTCLLFALMLVQVSTPFIYSYAMSSETPPAVAQTPLANPVNLNTLTMLTLDYDSDNRQYSLIVSSPGQYSFNMSFIVDSAGPWPHVDLNVYLRENMVQYIPHLHGDLDGMNGFRSWSWLFRNTGYSDSEYYEFVAIQPGRIIIDFQMNARTSTDQISVNFTLSQLYTFASVPSVDWDQPPTLDFTSDNSWMGTRFVLPQNNMYNLSMFAELDYATTAGWGGNPVFQPFNKLTLLTATYGERNTIDTYNPVFSIPIGAGSGSVNWTSWDLFSLTTDTYYLFGYIDDFEFLNGSQVTIQLDITPVAGSTIAPDESVRLRFDNTPGGNSAYVGLTAPIGSDYDIFFDSHAGANWTVQAFDPWGGWVPIMYTYYEDPTSYTISEDRFEQAFSFIQPGMMISPTPTSGVLGDAYIELYNLGGSDITYINDSAQAFSMHPGLLSPFDTYFIRIDASTAGTPTTTFNITLHLQASTIPTIVPAVPEVFAVNQTIGPLYQRFQLPIISGYIYEISAWASEYTASGGVSLFTLPGPAGYADWQWGNYFIPLYHHTPTSSSPYDVSAINETATMRFVAVRSTNLYFGALGDDMSGPPSDTTEVTVEVTITAPLPYTLGTVETATISDMDFKTYSFSIMAGASYQVSLSLDSAGNYGLLSVFNSFGHVPFHVTLSDLWCEVSSGYLNMTRTLSALVSGVVTIVLVAQGTVHFAFNAVGEAPGSFALGLIIGLIFMIMAIIIVYIVMRRRY
ncbi:MAG: hypothetical protein ACFE89_09470 [Candidatus Hodarchaeota archaeon]